MKKNVFSITVTEEKDSNSISWKTETSGRATESIKSYLLEYIVEDMVKTKYRPKVIRTLSYIFNLFNK